MFLWKLFKTDNILYRKILIHRFNELRYTVFNKQDPSPLLEILNICVKYNLYKAVCQWFNTCLIPPKREWQSTVFKAVSVHEYGFWRANCLLYPSCNLCIKVCPEMKLCIWLKIAKENVYLSSYCRTAFRLLTRSSSLAANAGRYNNVKKCNRLCPLCMVEIENEEHFLWRCIKLSDHRDVLCQAIKYN